MQAAATTRRRVNGAGGAPHAGAGAAHAAPRTSSLSRLAAAAAAMSAPMDAPPVHSGGLGVGGAGGGPGGGGSQRKRGHGRAREGLDRKPGEQVRADGTLQSLDLRGDVVGVEIAG